MPGNSGVNFFTFCVKCQVSIQTSDFIDTIIITFFFAVIPVLLFACPALGQTKRLERQLRNVLGRRARAGSTGCCCYRRNVDSDVNTTLGPGKGAAWAAGHPPLQNLFSGY